VPADDLVRVIALQLLGADVPGEDVAARVEREDGVVANARDEQAIQLGGFVRTLATPGHPAMLCIARRGHLARTQGRRASRDVAGVLVIGRTCGERQRVLHDDRSEKNETPDCASTAGLAAPPMILSADVRPNSTRLVALDWGTTSLRAYLLGTAGRTRAASGAAGHLRVPERDFRAAFDASRRLARSIRACRRSRRE
jgi:hypothetical protein